MQYFALSQGKLTLALLVTLLAVVFIGSWAGIYQSKKRAKTAMPDKDTEIDQNS